MSTIRFTKMHGAGNDYVYINTLLYNIDNPKEISLRLSRPHFGVGSDGLVLIGAPSNANEADFSMRIYNADGSEAMMCGNASRCVGKYLYERNLTDKTSIRLETNSGVKVLHLCVKNDKVKTVTVDMLAPILQDPTQFDQEAYEMVGKSIASHDKKFSGTFVSMGNPHFVIFVSDILQIDVAKYGSALECNKIFPDRSNIEFAQVMEGGEIRTRVWERGSGITLACGTGACATLVAATITGRSKRENNIIMDGGVLCINWDEATNHVFMTGGAEEVFEGEINI